MPKPGLSLVGFLGDAEQAIDHLRRECVPNPGRDSEAALVQDWRNARAKLGARVAGAGFVDPEPMPQALQGYVEALQKQPWMAEHLGELDGASFRVVEIDPLLCHQVTIDKTRVDQLWDRSRSPTLANLLEVCLPMDHPAVEFDSTPVSPDSTSVLLRSPRTDLRVGRSGVFAGASVILLGARAGVAMPFVHVARIAGRCHLVNGYHRVFAARSAGATHVPCVFRDAPSYEAAGYANPALQDGRIRFPASLLMSDNPPTVAHLTQERAHEVSLRDKSRVIHVTWHQYTTFVE